MILGERPLKSVSIADIQKAIAEALEKLVSTEYEVKISSIDFDSDINAWYNDLVEIKLSLQKPSKSSVFGRGSDESLG
ncbi:hypothetical protein [Aeromonas hydrophila]|uniref:hypothetical protein n=1 Tax=Aeromonas hydrophila TaxID=644 RepID=UPI0024415E74|nr:hypothetical protein [Aeromonas hydrophila]